MKLLVVDQQGNELKLARVSLIEGGVEIVVGGIHESVRSEVQHSATSAGKPAAAVNESTATDGDGSKAASVFDNDSQSNAERTAGSHDGSAAGSVLESGDSASVEVDANGRAWDERIDSSNQKKVVSTGIWARRRNLEDAVYAGIVQELLAVPDPEADALPGAPDDDLPLPAADDDLPLPEAEEVPLPDNNEIGSADSELTGILDGW